MFDTFKPDQLRAANRLPMRGNGGKGEEVPRCHLFEDEEKDVRTDAPAPARIAESKAQAS